MSIHLITGISGVGKSFLTDFVCKKDGRFQKMSFSAFATNWFERKFNRVIDKKDLPSFLLNPVEYECCIQGFCIAVEGASINTDLLIDSGASAVDIGHGIFFPVFYGFSPINFNSLVFVKSNPIDIVERNTIDDTHRIHRDDPSLIADFQNSLEIGMHIRARGLSIPFSVIFNKEIDIAAQALVRAIELAKLSSFRGGNGE